MKKVSLVASLILFIFLAWAPPVLAGFGISPPNVRTSKPVFAGSHFEQKITLLRSSAEEVLTAKITVNAPEIESWIKIDHGFEFDLPKGNTRVPMIVIVDVPKDAEIGEYKGYMNVKVVPKESTGGGGVAIALGARIELEINVTDEPFVEFLVRKVEVSDFKTLGSPWNWKIFLGLFDRLFYRARVAMKIENTGNIKVAPTKVVLDVYDRLEKELIESYVDESIKKVPPFATETVTASFSTKLPPGGYWGQVKIYKDNEIIRKDKLLFQITPYDGQGFDSGPGVWAWVVLGIIILIILIIIFVLIKIKIWRNLFKILFILSWPARFAWIKIKRLVDIIKFKFWKWIHQKSARYQDTEVQAPAESPKIPARRVVPGNTRPKRQDVVNLKDDK